MKRFVILFSLSYAIVCGLANAAFSQATGDAFSGFRTSNNSPIQIEADSLEVRDGENLAIFKGNVDVKQGETTMRTSRLNVYYNGSVNPGGVGGDQGIKRIEARGKVWVNSGNNTATGDRAIFNLQSQIVVMTGSEVILTQCNNIIRGKKLTVNLTTNAAQLSGGRVQGVLSRNGSNGSQADKKCL